MMTNTDHRLNTNQLKAELAEFYGSEELFKLPIPGDLRYTEGVRCFAMSAGSESAYWFLDTINAHVLPLQKEDNMLVITLDVRLDFSALVSVTDGDGNLLLERPINITDVQAGSWMFWLQNNVLHLPSEH